MRAALARQSAVKRVGVEGIADFIATACPTGNRDALLSLLWRRYVPKHYRDSYRFRDIAERTGVSKSMLARATE